MSFSKHQQIRTEIKNTSLTDIDDLTGSNDIDLSFDFFKTHDFHKLSNKN